MKKIIRKLVSIACGAALLFGLAACGGGGDGSSTTIAFWGYGNEVEIQLTRELVDEFNKTNTSGITVNYTPVKTGDYE